MLKNVYRKNNIKIGSRVCPHIGRLGSHGSPMLDYRAATAFRLGRSFHFIFAVPVSYTLHPNMIVRAVSPYNMTAQYTRNTTRHADPYISYYYYSIRVRRVFERCTWIFRCKFLSPRRGFHTLRILCPPRIVTHPAT